MISYEGYMQIRILNKQGESLLSTNVRKELSDFCRCAYRVTSIDDKSLEPPSVRARSRDVATH